MNKLYKLDNCVARTLLGSAVLAVIAVLFGMLVELYEGIMAAFFYLMQHQRTVLYVLVGFVVTYLVGSLCDILLKKDSHILFKRVEESQ